jgi:hypothetical protein
VLGNLELLEKRLRSEEWMRRLERHVWRPNAAPG